MRTRLIPVGLLATLIAVSGVGVGSSVTASRSSAQEQRPRISFIVYTDASVEFFVPVVHGAEEAAELHGVDLEVQYANGDPVEQNNLIETAVANQADAIAVSLSQNFAFDESVCAARDAGIPVVAFNVDATEGAARECRMAFMGQDFEETGYLIGQRMIEDHGITSGDLVFCPVEAPEAVYATARYAGVKRALDEVGARSELVGTGFNLADVQTTEVQYLVGHQDTKAIIALGSAPLTVAAQATAEAAMNIPIGGFDLTEDIIAGIQDGTITASVDQQPYSQGFYAVAQLALYLKYALYPSDMDTGGQGLVDQTNVERVAPLVGEVR